MTAMGILYGVGVGPGAPDLLTLRAVRVLESAEVLAVPRSSDFGASVAWSIVEPIVGAVTYTAEELDAQPGIENPSDTVKRHVGARGVAEPAALRSAGAEKLVVPKQTYTEEGAGRSMTFAVARVPFAKRSEVRSG